MTIGRLLLDLWLGLVVLSLVAVALFALAWMVLPVVTVVGARRRAERPRVSGAVPESLAQAYPEGYLAKIDEALEAILAQEQPGILTPRR